MILALLSDFAGRPNPHLFSAEGWGSLHKDERERLLKSVFLTDTDCLPPLRDMGPAWFPELATVCEQHLPEHTDNLAPVACILHRPGSLSRLAEVGE